MLVVDLAYQARQQRPYIHRQKRTGKDGNLIPSGKVGIRPQLMNLRYKKLEIDFIIEGTPSSMHVLNAISPAFTSAFTFSEMMVDRFETGHAR